MLLTGNPGRDAPGMHGVSHEIHTFGGRSTSLMQAGEGAASVVWFPAVGDAIATFRPMLITLAKRLSGVARVIAVDPPGYGKSPLPAGALMPTYRETYTWAADVLSELGVGGRPLIPVGHSSGAAMATAGITGSVATVLGLIFVSFADWRLCDIPTGAHLCPTDLAAFHRLLGQSWHTPPRVPDLIANQIIEKLCDPVYRAHVDSFNVAEVGAEIDRYKGRLALIGGLSDALVPPAAIEATARSRQGTQVRWIPECGHYAHREKPNELTNHLVELIKELVGHPNKSD